MTFDTDTARLLGETATRWAEQHYDMPRRRARLQQPGAFDADTWQRYAELGWLALRLPAGEGGFDADALAIGTLMEVVGERLLLEPLLASAVVATGLVVQQGTPAQRRRWLPALAEGRCTLAWAGPSAACRWRDGALHGRADAVLHGDVATAIVVVAHDSVQQRPVLRLVDVAALAPQHRLRHRLLDGRGAASLVFDATPAEPLGADEDAAAAIASAQAEATLAQCAEALGCVRALLAATREHLALRQQFGRPLATHQVLQHRVVDMFILQQEIAALTADARQSLALPPARRDATVAATRAYVSRAAREVANAAVQLHGGLGITDELAVSHHFRRLMVNATLFGDRDAHFATFMAGARETAAC